MQQQRYWNYLVQTIGHSRYLHHYREQTEETERRISMTAAITSSASIAGWAIWQNFHWLWAGIIASSQVLSSIRTYLPYARRAEMLRDAASAFKGLAMRVEGSWFRVQEGLLSEEEINELITLFQKEQLEIEDKVFSKITLPQRQDILMLAEQESTKYIATYYGQQ